MPGFSAIASLDVPSWLSHVVDVEFERSMRMTMKIEEYSLMTNGWTDCGMTHMPDANVRKMLKSRAPELSETIDGMTFGEIKE
jgi:hypothetical protein